MTKQEVMFVGQFNITDQYVHVFVSLDFIYMNFNVLSHLILFIILKNCKKTFEVPIMRDLLTANSS